MTAVYLSAALALKIAGVVPFSQHPWQVVVRPNLWECGALRSHTGCSSGLVCNENGDKRRASKYLRRVLERFFGASISLPTKTSWCQATVVALLWSAMQITGDDASRELGRAVAWLRPSG